MDLWRFLKALKLGIIIAYFIDIQTDGDLDLPHLSLNKVAMWLKRKINGGTKQHSKTEKFVKVIREYWPIVAFVSVVLAWAILPILFNPFR